MTTQIQTTGHPLVQSFNNVHTALRTDLKALDSAIQRRGDLGKPELERANRWFEFYWQQLAAHHNGEDTYFYPAIAKYDKNFTPEIEKLTGQHHQMDHLAEELKATYSRAAMSRDVQEYRDLARRYGNLISTLNTTMNDHLAHEEGILFPSIANNMPVDDQVAIDSAYIKKVPMKELSWLAPWLLTNMSTEQAQEMRGKVPWVIRFLYDNFWIKKYKTLVATFRF